MALFPSGIQKLGNPKTLAGEFCIFCMSKGYHPSLSKHPRMIVGLHKKRKWNTWRALTASAADNLKTNTGNSGMVTMVRCPVVEDG